MPRSLRSFFVALLFCATNAVYADTAPGPAKDAFDMWLSGVNSGSQKDIESFLTRHKTQYDVQDDIDFHNATGGLNVLRVVTNTGRKVEAFVRAKSSDTAWLVTLEVNPKDPLHVTNLQLAGTELPDDLKIKRWQLPELIAETDRRIGAMAAEDRLSGCLLLAQDTQAIYQRCVGRENREAGVPNTLDTRFRIASLGKMLTAVGILKLVDVGKIGLDDTIAQHLPQYPDASIAKRISIRQLLNHTSGLGDIFGKEAEAHKDELRKLADYIAANGRKPLQFEPGSRDGYSNYAYIVLGAIIEKVSGTSYYDYVQKHIYDPAGMQASGADPESTRVPHRAVPYTHQDGNWIEEKRMLPWRATSAGGSYTTIGDLLRFANALQAGALIRPATLEAATRPQNVNRWYGYGFMAGKDGADKRFGHEGGAPGMNAVFWVYPNGHYVVIGLSNFDPAAMGDMVNFVGNRVPLAGSPLVQSQ
jgi:CubicO group peptidase (beta-lactamase class C family)